MRSISESNNLAESMCKSGYRYLYGAKGQEYTSALVRRLAAQYPSFYNPISYAMQDADKGYKAIDCSGFVCKVLDIPAGSSSMIKSDAIKVLPVSKNNAREGMAIWKSGHIAYVGKGLKIYEAAGTIVDMKVSEFDKRAKDFTYLLVCKNSYLAGHWNDSSSSASSSSGYFPKYTGTASGIDEIFHAIGADKYYQSSSYKYVRRRPIARVNGYPGDTYTGTATQNTALRNLARQGKLKKP